MNTAIHKISVILEDERILYTVRKKILLADSDTASYFLISELLADYNIRIIHARSGQEAIRLFRQNPFIDMVITEIKLPGLDGFEILKATRAINPFITAIAQTAYVHNNMKQKCLMSGFNEYIPKPIDFDLFVTVLKKYVPVFQNIN